MARAAPSSHRRSRLFHGTEGLITVGDWLRFATSLFNRESLVFAQGTSRAADEALALIRWALHFDEDLSPFLAARLTRSEIAEIQSLLLRRVVDRTPLAYLTGEAWYGDLRFSVDESVLIPRSYFVELIESRPGIGRWLGRRQPRRILELCTGCGCLAILLARRFPKAVVDATDISENALAVAEHNTEEHNLTGRVNLLCSDVFETVPPLNYDLIVANPPYEPSAICGELPPELRHEPRSALDGGRDGLDVIRRIIDGARSHLSAGGVLAIEIGGLRGTLENTWPGVPFRWPQLQDGTDAVVVVGARNLPRGV